MREPTRRQLGVALDVLAWLHETNADRGRLRDEIARIRDALWDVIEAKAEPESLRRGP